MGPHCLSLYLALLNVSKDLQQTTNGDGFSNDFLLAFQGLKRTYAVLPNLL